MSYQNTLTFLRTGSSPEEGTEDPRYVGQTRSTADAGACGAGYAGWKPGEACGQWASSTVIRAPYRNIDKASRSIAPLGPWPITSDAGFTRFIQNLVAAITHSWDELRPVRVSTQNIQALMAKQQEAEELVAAAQEAVTGRPVYRFGGEFLTPSETSFAPSDREITEFTLSAPFWASTKEVAQGWIQHLNEVQYHDVGPYLYRAWGFYENQQYLAWCRDWNARFSASSHYSLCSVDGSFTAFDYLPLLPQHLWDAREEAQSEVKQLLDKAARAVRCMQEGAAWLRVYWENEQQYVKKPGLKVTPPGQKVPWRSFKPFKKGATKPVKFKAKTPKPKAIKAAQISAIRHGRVLR